MSVDRAFVADFASRWGDAWNAHDADAVLAMLAPDIEWAESGVRRVLRGLSEARFRVEADFRAVPDLHGESLQIFVDSQAAGAAVHWRLGGTYEGARPVTFEGVSLWRFDGELLSRLQMMYDVADVRAQAGLDDRGARPPARGVQRLAARAREARKR